MARNEIVESVRLDKWLWCARFFRTRALTATAVKANKIRVNGQAIKAAKSVRVGDKVQIRKTPFQYSVTILKLTNNRLSASQAALLYEEEPNSIKAREQLSMRIKTETASYPKTIGRPTKRNRRKIIRFTRANQNSDNGS